jgi:hypothetical protein
MKQFLVVIIVTRGSFLIHWNVKWEPVDIQPVYALMLFLNKTTVTRLSR